uniref:Ovule protein n=1 Tax=Angiostrongylus cantonensis TaxID=6313 RepID=A0A0K0DDX4_ANGCA
MNENEIVLDSSSDESIVAEQAKKLFNICDSDEKGFYGTFHPFQIRPDIDMREVRQDHDTSERNRLDVVVEPLSCTASDKQFEG